MITVANDFNLFTHNTFKMNVNARQWVEVTSTDDIPYVFNSVIRDDKFRCVGQGSNLLFTSDYDGTLLHLCIFTLESYYDELGDTIIKAGAGIKFDTLIEMTTAAGIWGLENLSYIPGETGAAAVQNIGAYGVEVKDFIEEVECYDIWLDKIVKFSNSQCKYGYRDSIFKTPESRKRYVVTEVTLRLSKNLEPKLDYGNLKSVLTDKDNLTPQQVRKAIIDIRRQKLPEVDEVGSAGSFFKNPIVTSFEFEHIQQIAENMGLDRKNVPHFQIGENQVKVPAAWLIDKAGCKELTVGGASIWEKQPLVIVNKTGHACPEDIVELERRIINKVDNLFEISLEPEVDHLD